MQGVFPNFKPFAKDHRFGFSGYLAGPRSGQLYQVRIEADEMTYPQWPPNVSMSPMVGDNWVEHRGQRVLCAVRDWQAARSTFANTVLVVIRYLNEHDGVSSSAARYARGQEVRRPDR
jgi:ubiquitin-protein ligase